MLLAPFAQVRGPISRLLNMFLVLCICVFPSLGAKTSSSYPCAVPTRIDYMSEEASIASVVQCTAMMCRLSHIVLHLCVASKVAMQKCRARCAHEFKHIRVGACVLLTLALCMSEANVSWYRTREVRGVTGKAISNFKNTSIRVSMLTLSMCTSLVSWCL